MAGQPAATRPTAPPLATSNDGSASFDPFFGGAVASVPPTTDVGGGMMMNGGGSNYSNAMATNGLGVDCGVHASNKFPVMNANNGNNWQAQYQRQQQFHYQYQQHQQQQPSGMMMMNINSNFSTMQQQPPQHQKPQFLDYRTVIDNNYTSNGIAATSGWPATNATGGGGWGTMGVSSAAVGSGGFTPSSNAPAADRSGNNKPDPFAGLGF
jgi:hypothetical protein